MMEIVLAGVRRGAEGKGMRGLDGSSRHTHMRIPYHTIAKDGFRGLGEVGMDRAACWLAGLSSHLIRTY
jgi:hypothetical protein